MIKNFIEKNPKISLLFGGLLSSLAFASTFIFPAAFLISILTYLLIKSENLKQASLYGWIFGFGHFLTGLHWIVFSVESVFDEFWWAIPFILLGLPAFVACFIVIPAAIGWIFRNKSYYVLAFSIAWVISELLRSILFTGFPWNLLGYIFSCSIYLIQPASVIWVYGLSFVAIFISSGFYKNLFRHLVISLVIIATMLIFGYWRLHNNPTKFTDIKARIVQPNTPQGVKWDPENMLNNIIDHINLSLEPSTIVDFSPDIIIWPEAAITLNYKNPYLRKIITENLFRNESEILITGAIDFADPQNYKIHTSAFTINSSGEVISNYAKRHLVPFGEYIPLKGVFPFLKKITPGLVDYTPKNSEEVAYLSRFNLRIKHLICYEIIFPYEVKTDKNLVDVIVNITNDSWFGMTTGPYQHLYIAQMRAVENQIPIIRATNGGISAIIDSSGRIINKSSLNERTYVDFYIPK